MLSQMGEAIMRIATQSSLEGARPSSGGARRLGAGLLVGFMLGAIAPVWAQGGAGGGGGGGGTGGGTGLGQPGGVGSAPEQEVAIPREPVPPVLTAGKLLGDPGGLRSKLLNAGVNLQLDYTGEIATNLSGQRKGFGYAHQFGLSADINWEKAANVPGFNTHFVAVNRAGRNLSRDFIGDNISQATEVYGAGFNVATKLVYLYAEEKLFGDRVNIAAGRLPVGVDFASSPLACIAVALTPGCGVPRALANTSGFTTFPQSGWGGRVRVRPTAETYFQVGAYEVQPFPAGGRTGLNWSTNRDTGVLIPVELGYEPIIGPNQLIGHYKVGYARDTSDYPDLFTNSLGQPISFGTQPGQTRKGRDEFWVMADQMVVRHGKGQNDGLILMASYAHSSSNTTFNSDTAFFAIIDRGYFRPADTMSFSAGWFGISDQLGKLQQFSLDTGRPLANGARGPQRSEYVLELNYTATVARGVEIEPAIQYFIYPNADRRTKNALVLAARFHIDF